ncbi:prolyl 3-hydroxylase /prolyl 3,4-dihydroxylase [Nematocida sp. AWRm80]|nr:prolyl 3-hydroxylase /prolyl 3,4-dihydroxylase [Nematocida sp. AWRm80]
MTSSSNNSPQTLETQSTTPFYHRIIDDFLPESLFTAVEHAYIKTPVYEKYTDLYHFYQSNELKDNPMYQKFKSYVRNALDTDIAYNKKTVSGESINLFASCYMEGDFLLPHDDCLDNRLFAFSFYLNTPGETIIQEIENISDNMPLNTDALESNTDGSKDKCPGGRLIIYDNNGIDPVKYIEPKRNRIVIFEVSPLSYHEVEKTNATRMAITGWLTSDGYYPTSILPQVHKLKYWIFNTTMQLDLPLSQLDTITKLDYPEEYIQPILDSLKQQSWNRRYNSIICKAYEPSVPGKECSSNSSNVPVSIITLDGYPVDTLVLKLDRSGYLLLNDPYNSTDSDILVVFVISLSKEPFANTISLIKKDGTPLATLDSPGYYIVKHPNAKVFVSEVTSLFYLLSYKLSLKPV